MKIKKIVFSEYVQQGPGLLSRVCSDGQTDYFNALVEARQMRLKERLQTVKRARSTA